MTIELELFRTPIRPVDISSFETIVLMGRAIEWCKLRVKLEKLGYKISSYDTDEIVNRRVVFTVFENEDDAMIFKLTHL